MKTLFKTALLFLVPLFACITLYCPLVWGNPYLGLMSKGVAASGGAPDFYHNADSLSTTPTIGTGAIIFSEGILLETTDPISGAGSWDNNNDGWDRITIPVDGNLDWDNGEIGFYFRPNENNDGRLVYAEGATGDFEIKYHSETTISFNYKDIGSTCNHGMTTFDGTVAYHIRVKFTSGTNIEIFIDGESVCQGSGATGTIEAPWISLSAADAYQWDGVFDQVMMNVDDTFNTYTNRDKTSF